MTAPSRPKQLMLEIAVAGLATLLTASGCATARRLPVDAQRYRLAVHMDPSTHGLLGRATIDLVRADDELLAENQPVAIELLLHPNLEISRIEVSGAQPRSARFTRLAPAIISEDEDDFVPRRYVVYLRRPADAFTLFIDYHGKLYQNVSAGEQTGEIHNFSMRAHIGEDGIYLADGYWYPQPVGSADKATLAEFTVIADPVPGFELVAAGDRDPGLAEREGRLAWRSPYPIDKMVIVGGAHEVHRADHGDVAISVHLKPSQSQHAEGLIDTVRRNLDRYEPLIGDYPAADFAIVDNFFSSGFAFPTFTLLSSAVIDMGERSQATHGYIDHEMLHSWWGNGIHVDPSDGDWCEGLASYAANYYGFVLDGDEQEARRMRRNYSHFLSRMDPEEDRPLGTFGRANGCSRNIAYRKGAAVFHMLARKIGQENFWAAMRRLTAEFVGETASWEDIRSLCEQQSGSDLKVFFDQWVRGTGAVQVKIDRAHYNSAEQTLTLALSQGEPAFEVDLPIRLTNVDGTEDIVVQLRDPEQEFTVPVNGIPLGVEIDADFHIFRKVDCAEIVPTTACTRHGNAFTTVLPDGAVAGQYRNLQAIFESSFAGPERLERIAGSIEGEALAERCALILGEAVRDPYIAAFLSAIEFPVRWNEEGFEFDGVDYTDPGDAVLCTVVHPGVDGGGVTVVYANSPEAIPRAFTIPMYQHSVVVFRDARAQLRQDLERHTVVPVEGS